MNTKWAISSVLVAGVLGISAANATPMLYIGYSLDGGATKQLLQTSASGDAVYTGDVGANSATTAKFHISVSAIAGFPTLTEPSAATNTITTRIAPATGRTDANSGVNSAQHLLLYFTQTGLTTPVSGFSTGWANNSLNSVTVTLTDYAQACVVAGCGTTIASGDVFATTNELATETLAAGQAAPVTFSPDMISAGTFYDETFVYDFSLGRGASLNANVNLDGVPLREVAEPLTLSLFGVGVSGAAALRRRKKVKTS